MPSACPADSFQFLTVLQRTAHIGFGHLDLLASIGTDNIVGVAMMQSKAFTVQ
jgi:hypothetical protein